jgi:hypothetical protein
MCTYNSPREDREREAIKTNFPDHEIVNPGTYEDTPEKREREMEYCRDLVKTCQALAFSTLYGHVSSGVGLEIDTALSIGIPVYEVDEKGLGETNKPNAANDLAREN